jgi:hypothetical protein
LIHDLRANALRLSRGIMCELTANLRPLFDIWKAVQLESEASVPAVQSNRIFTAGCNAMPGKMPGCGK